MKKVTIVFIVIGLVTIGAYLLARLTLRTPGFRSAQAADTSLRTHPQETILDLRPRLIKRLQKLVHTASDGRMALYIKEAEPDVLASVLTLRNVTLEPDSSKLQRQDLRNANLFRFKCDSIRITGIGIQDILSKDEIELKRIFINAPVISLYQTAGKEVNDTLSLYGRLLGEIKKFSVEEIVVRDGTVINHQTSSGKPVSFQHFYATLSGLLIDSASQMDKSRFLFSKQATLSLKNYFREAANGLYNYSVGELSVNTSNHLLTAKNIKLQPRLGKKAFARSLGMAKERYELSLQSVQMKNPDWWNLASEKTLIAEEAVIDGGLVDIYFDRSLPQKTPRTGHYPHQLIMKLPMNINIRKVRVKNVLMSYEELNPLSGKPGRLTIKNLNGTITNLTNMASVIHNDPHTLIQANGNFMDLSRASLSLGFDLANYRRGSFTASMNIEGFEGRQINPLAEPIGMFSIKKGNLKQLRSSVSGDNDRAAGTVTFLYDNLHIAALEKDAGKKGGLDKKDVTSLMANTFLVKKNNPSGNSDARKVECDFVRDPYCSFFNLIWKTSFVGILKTTGLPAKLAYKK